MLAVTPSNIRCSASYPFNSIALLFRYRDGLCSRRHGGVIVAILTEELEELVGVRRNELR